MADAKGDFLASNYRNFNMDYAPSTGGGYFSYGATGEAYATPFYIPDGTTVTINAIYVANADATSDATLTDRIGLYEIIADLSLSLINDYGTITKDASAAGTFRQVGSNYTTTLGPDKMYAWVTLMEAGRAGATLGFVGSSGRQWWNHPWGAVGDNSGTDRDLFGGGGGSTGTFPGWSGLASGGLPSTLAIPTYITNNPRPCVVYAYVTAVS